MPVKRYTVTSALPYANGPLHIGHLAGVYIPADIYVRYLRLKGEDVLFLGGSDEHGVPITLRARKEGITPQQLVDKYHGMIKKSFEELGVSFDIYSRTSNKIHHETASDFFKTLYDKKEFIEEESEQFFDEEAQLFLADRYIVGTCPKCNNANAYGDQCEKCGTSLSPKELVNPHSALSGKPPVLKKTKHWYLPLDRMQKAWLEQWIDTHNPNDPAEGAEKWKVNVYGQCKSWLDQGLQPRAVTRDLDWGVPVPLSEAKGKVLYVWFDAPIGYISATKEWAADKEKNAKGVDWATYWKDPETKLVHFIGKDNIVFHCLIFPAMLKAEGSFILPDNVPANEFMNLEGEKISTSRNWAIWLHEYLEEFPGKQDVLRYVLCANIPETKDSDFTWKDFQARNNNELVAILGNFVNRTLVLMHKYFNGKVPDVSFAGDNKDFDKDFAQYADTRDEIQELTHAIERYRFRDALGFLMNIARTGNKYLTTHEPWKKFDEKNPGSPQNKEVAVVLVNCLHTIGRLAVLMEPFMPFTSRRLLKMLNLPDDVLTLQHVEFFEQKNGSEGDGAFPKRHLFAPGHLLNKPELLFEKIEDDAIARQIEKLQTSRTVNKSNTPPLPIPNTQPPLSYDHFSALDIRVGTILAAERVPKTDKLLKLTVDTGIDTRTVVSGIAAFYKPEDITGRQVSILINLEPRKIKGIESKGMILMAENQEGKLVFVSPAEKSDPGSVVR